MANCQIVIEAHPDDSTPDMRLTDPFPALNNLLDTIDFQVRLALGRVAMREC